MPHLLSAYAIPVGYLRSFLLRMDSMHQFWRTQDHDISLSEVTMPTQLPWDDKPVEFKGDAVSHALRTRKHGCAAGTFRLRDGSSR